MAQPNPVSISNEESQDLSTVESEAEVRVLLADASDLPPAERLMHLRSACKSTLALKLPVKKTLQLIEECREISVETIRELNQSYFGLTLPLQPKQEIQVNNAIALAESMESAYSTLASDVAANSQGLLLHRRMELLLEQFIFSATAYTPWSKGLWAQIHKIYVEANQRQVTKYKPAASGDDEPRSIRNLYAIAILTGAADPYQMPYRDTQKVRELSASLLDRVKVLAPGKLPSGQADPVCLLADPRIDKPALPHRTGKAINPVASLLDISKALAHLKKRLTVLEHDPSVVDPLFEKEPRNNVTALYRHLIIKWGWQPIRGAARNSVNLDFDLLAGFERILQELEWNPTLTSTEELPDKHSAAPSVFDVIEEGDEEEIVMEGDSIVMSGNVGGSWRSDEEETQSGSEFCYATSIDVSDTGLGLRIPSPPDTGLRVGEILCLRERSIDQHWTLGVVRWVKSVSGGELEIGVLKIPGIPQYAQLRSVELVRNAELKRQGDDVENMAVLVASDAESRQGRLRARLIVPGRDGTVESVSWLSFSGADRTVDSIKKFLSTRYVSCYSCKLSVPRTMPVLGKKPDKKPFGFS